MLPPAGFDSEFGRIFLRSAADGKPQKNRAIRFNLLPPAAAKVFPLLSLALLYAGAFTPSYEANLAPLGVINFQASHTLFH
jgi:hypothetical protein